MGRLHDPNVSTRSRGPDQYQKNLRDILFTVVEPVQPRPRPLTKQRSLTNAKILKTIRRFKKKTSSRSSQLVPSSTTPYVRSHTPKRNETSSTRYTSNNRHSRPLRGQRRPRGTKRRGKPKPETLRGISKRVRLGIKDKDLEIIVSTLLYHPPAGA